MQDYVLYYPKVAPTGRELGKQLGVKYGSRLKPLRGEASLRKLVRWGSQLQVNCTVTEELNHPSALAKASDKFRTLTLLQDAGILVPPFSLRAQDLRGTVLGRLRTGFGGRDIVVYEDGSILSGKHEFFSQYVPNTREFRIHVVRGEVIRVQGKFLDEPERVTNKYIKNHAQGYRFRDPGKTLNKDRTTAAIDSVRVLGLDFGAVDLIVGEDKKCYVLEVNTAPSCSPLTLSKYVEAFKRLGIQPSVYPVTKKPAPTIRASVPTKTVEQIYETPITPSISSSEPRRVPGATISYDPLSYGFHGVREPVRAKPKKKVKTWPQEKPRLQQRTKLPSSVQPRKTSKPKSRQRRSTGVAGTRASSSSVSRYLYR